MIRAIFSSQSSSWNLVERVVFPAPPPSYTIHSFPGELILIPREGGANVPCLFLPFQHARFLMMFFHANAEDLGLIYNFCTILKDLFQVNVLAVEYPGYGICPGASTEEGIMANAEAAMDFAIETLGVAQNDILLFGRSLGTGPTVALASRYHQIAGVVLLWSQDLCLYSDQTNAGDTSEYDTQLLVVARCGQFRHANDFVFCFARLRF